MTKTLDELMRIAGDEPAEWGPTGYTNAALESALRELIADAERYRWLREHPAWETEALLAALSPTDCDAHIDAARKG